MSGLEDPRISIIIISYNQGRFLEKAITSVIGQNYGNLELVVIDGGSTDESPEIIKRYERHFHFWISEKDKGQGHAINKGIAKSTGQMIGWLNSDDYFLPGALQAFSDAWRQAPEACAWVGNGYLVDEQGKTIKTVIPGKLDRDSLADWTANGFCQPACLFSRDALEGCDPIDESLFIAMDFKLWLTISRKGDFHRIDHVLAGATVHPGAKTQAYNSLRYVETWMVLLENGYHELAKRKMLEKLDADIEWKKKINRMTSSSTYKMIRPLIKTWFRN